MLNIKNVPITEEEHKIYARQIQDPIFGLDGQEKLKGSSVMVSRVGGLGGTVAMELARAGIGKLVLAHDGEVEHENLNRMHLAFRSDIGKNRVEVFTETLLRINPDLQVNAVSDNASEQNADELVSYADVVVDAAPLFEERYAMNRAIVKQRKPMVTAGMYGLEGYVSTIIPGHTPCMSCLFPDPPEGWDLRCFPVITPSPVLIATIAVMEVIKIITNKGEMLTNTLLHTDLLNNSFRKLSVERNVKCEVCGTNNN